MIVGVDMPIQIDAELKDCFPGLQVLAGHVKDVKVERSGLEIQSSAVERESLNERSST